MTLRRLAFCPPLIALLLAGIGRGQTSASSDEIQILTRQCRATETAGQMREKLAQHNAGSSPAVPDDFAAAWVACAQLDAALQASDATRVREVASELRLIYARLNQPPAPPKERLAIMEASASGLSGLQRFYKLAGLAKLALEAEEIDKAQSYARELLALAPEYPKDWNYGNAIYYGYFVLGRVALRHGNVPLAAQYLIDAGSTPGSPQLNSFGPNVTLAKELLEKGQAAAVLQYFALCKNFWKLDHGRLDEWSATVRGGGIPNFTSNLNY
jgi:hypothetical protein